MKEYFTEEQKEQNLHQIELEDLVLYADYIEGEGPVFTIIGRAEVDGENYPDFEVEFETEEMPEELSVSSIMDMDWKWYEYKFKE